MHELSIAMDLVQIASQAAEQAGVTAVTAVYLKLGTLSGVVEEALRFGYDIVTQGTPLENSQLIIQPVPAVVRCPTCGEGELVSIQRFCCPQCAAPTADLVHGRELEIVAIEYEDEVPETAVFPTPRVTPT